MSAEGSLPTDLLLKVEGRITNAARLSHSTIGRKWDLGSAKRSKEEALCSRQTIPSLLGWS